MIRRVLVSVLLLLLPATASAQVRAERAIAIIDSRTGDLICEGDCGLDPLAEAGGRFVVGPEAGLTNEGDLRPSYITYDGWPTRLALGNLRGVYTYGPAGMEAQSLQAPNRSDVVNRVAAACPGLIRQDHAFTDAVASVLNAEDARWGRNGKRGNAGDPSHDAVAFRNPSSPFGVSIVDIIVGAGGANPGPSWQDKTEETLSLGTTGVWVAPSGRLPACLTGGGSPAPTPTPTPTPAPSPAPVDLSAVLAKLDAINARLASLEARPVPEPSHPPDLALLEAYIDDMVGAGPGGDPATVPNHVSDIKQRLDVLRVTLEQLVAWLRSRPVLRF